MSIIYHHTTADGLLGIISKLTLWATDIGFLNDFREFHHGIEVVSTICGSYSAALGQEEGGAKNEMRQLYKMMPQLLEESMKNRQTFVTSFTRNRDDLRQWMSYGKPNSSYSVGFFEESLKDLPLELNNPLRRELAYQFKTVAYGSNEPIESLLNPDRLLEEVPTQDDVAGYATNLVNELMFGCCSGKSKQFYDESEVRLVFQARKIGIPYSDVKFRVQGGVLVPYIEVPIARECLSEIIIGPNVNSDLATKGLLAMLKANGLSCQVHTSECTLRQY